MEPSNSPGTKESALAVWRDAHRRLRALERQLVQEVTQTEASPALDTLFRDIETLRQNTTKLFALAQVESVASHVKAQRIGHYVTRPVSSRTERNPLHRTQAARQARPCT